MNKDIIEYCSAIAQARRLMKMGIISEEDYERIDHALVKKYDLPLSSLFRDIELLFWEGRGTMPD